MTTERVRANQFGAQDYEGGVLISLDDETYVRADATTCPYTDASEKLMAFTRRDDPHTLSPHCSIVLVCKQLDYLYVIEDPS